MYQSIARFDDTITAKAGHRGVTLQCGYQIDDPVPDRRVSWGAFCGVPAI